MFKRIVLTVVSVTLVTVMAFAVLSGVYAADEDRIYYSDLFFGFSPDYLNDKEVEKNVWEKYSSLRLHTRETGDIMEKIYNDYADSFAGFWSSFKTGLNYSTDAMFSLKFKDYANLMSDTYGNTEHIYTNSLDDANMEMVKYLLKTSVGDAALFGGNGTGVAAKTMKFMKDLAEFYEDIRKNYVIEKMTDYEIVEIVFEEARNGGLFVHISSTNLTLVEEVILEDLSGHLKMFGAAAKAFEMMQTIFVGIMLEDVRMDVINDVIRASSSDYCVYDGMIRLRDKLSGGFLQYFTDNYFQPKIIDKLHGEIADALLSPLGTTYGLIGDALSIASTVVFDILFDVPDLGEMTKQKTLASYSSELYEILRGKLLSFYGNVDSNDVRELESIFAAYIAATNAALEESRSMAKDNEYELGQIILVWEDYDYSTFIGEITESISSIPAAERELKDHGTVSNLTSTFRAASDVLEEDSIYLCNGAFNGSLAYNTDATIKVEDGVAPYINGSLTITSSSYDSKSVKVPEGMTFEIGGDIFVEGNNDNYAYLRNEGTLICNGDITANSRGWYNAPSTNTSTLVVRGNVSFTEPYTVYGTVVFDGDEQQEIDMSYVKNIEVTNKNGIKYLDNLYLEGSFKLNGNPLDLNGFKTYLRGNSTLDGSNFGEVVVNTDYTLTYDVNANVKITTLGSSSTSLTIPEDADVEINGNVNVSGISDYYAYLKNNGRLTVNGDITTSSRGWYNAPSTNTSTLIVRGNVSFTEPYTIYGTVVFDGDEQQEIDMSYVKNIEVTNKNGIKYLDNLFLEGSFKLNGNPLDLNGFNTYLEGNATLDGSDFHEVVVRSNYTLTYDVNANVTVIGSQYSGTTLTIPEGADVEINGNVKVTGTIDYYAYLKNNGRLTVNGDITTSSRGWYNAPSTNTSTLIVRGNVSFAESFTVYGTVVFDGDEQQEIDMSYVKNIEVTNKNGIKYLDNLYLEGSFKLNGNPLELNGFNTYLEGNATLDGSDFHDVVVRSDYTLTYDVNANVKITTLGSSSTSLTIPEDADVEINGNVNVAGISDYYAYLKNNGKLSVGGDLTVGNTGYYRDTEASTLVLKKNVSINSSIKGTVVFDGDEQQELDMSYVKNIEVTNEKGIKYLDNLYLEGSFKLNGNPLDLNGFNTYLERNATLDGSDFHDVVVRSDYTLTYDVNANVTVIASQYSGTSLTILEGAEVEINGNVTFKGNNTFSSYLRNEGTLTIDGDITIGSNSSYVDSANSVLIVTGDVIIESTRTIYGTIVFDGDDEQKADLRFAAVIEIKNGSDAGVVFEKSINVSKLFDHKGNSFTLYNNGSGSTFVDYDGDGLNDNVDPHPTIKESEIEYTLTLKDENGEPIFSEVYKNGEEVLPPIIVPEETFTHTYTFLGWATSPMGAVEYPAGELITISEDITLYAVVEKKTKPAFIVYQPTNESAQNGEKVSTTVIAAGEDLTYTWYYTSNGNSNQFFVSSVTGATYSTVMNDSRAGRKVYCVITDKYGNSVTTEVVTLSMLSNVTITKQPTNVTAANGETASTTVEAEGEGLTYTWYYTLNKNGVEFYVSSVTGATYTTVMNDSRAGRKVYCVITDKYGNSVTTEVVTLSMLSNVIITKQPTNITAANGETASTTVVAEGEDLTYTWYYTSNGNTTEFFVSSVTGATYTTVMNDSRAGRKVYCVITDKYGNSVTTEVVTLSMLSNVIITKQPTNITVANGTTVSTTVVAEGEGLTYTWYYTLNKNGVEFYVSSVTGATYTTVMNDSRAGRKVYCVITDKYGNSVTTEVVTLSMSSELAITKQPTSVIAANGEKVATTVEATGEGLTYTWYYTSNGKTNQFFVSSVTGATYTTTMDATRDGRKVYCVITDKYGNTVTTDVVTLTMK